MLVLQEDLVEEKLSQPHRAREIDRGIMRCYLHRRKDLFEAEFWQLLVTVSVLPALRHRRHRCEIKRSESRTDR